MSASLIHEKCRKKKEINQWAGLITLVYLSCSGWRRIRVGRNHTRATRRLFPLCQHVHETNAHVRATIEFHNKHKCTSYRMVFFCRSAPEGRWKRNSIQKYTSIQNRSPTLTRRHLLNFKNPISCRTCSAQDRRLADTETTETN